MSSGAINRIQFLGFPLDAGVGVDTVCGLLDQKGTLRLVSFINPGSWALSRKRADYLPALLQMTLVLANGKGIACLCRLFTREDFRSVGFDASSLALRFFEAAVAKKAKLMLIGGDPGVDENVQVKLRVDYPALKIVGIQHAYGEIGAKVADIMSKSPDVVIVGIGSPRQEILLLALKDAGYRGMAITCGDFFNQYLETRLSYPAWIEKWNLQALYRFYNNPGRLWPRYFIIYPCLFLMALKELAHKIMGRFRAKAENARPGT